MHDVCLTPVNTPAAAFADPHVFARGVVVSGDGLRAVRAPFAASPTPLGPAPAVGADRDLLRTVGKGRIQRGG
jgi:crotonobetainyl-CoA:carnitine CoA-transferase CaiB-like acyl-CoA transferase